MQEDRKAPSKKPFATSKKTSPSSSSSSFKQNVPPPQKGSAPAPDRNQTNVPPPQFSSAPFPSRNQNKEATPNWKVEAESPSNWSAPRKSSSKPVYNNNNNNNNNNNINNILNTEDFEPKISKRKTKKATKSFAKTKTKVSSDYDDDFGGGSYQKAVSPSSSDIDMNFSSSSSAMDFGYMTNTGEYNDKFNSIDNDELTTTMEKLNLYSKQIGEEDPFFDFSSDKCLRIGIIGSVDKIGKSSIRRKFFPNDQQLQKCEGYDLILTDISHTMLQENLLEKMEGFILLFSTKNINSFDGLEEIAKKIRSFKRDSSSITIILVANIFVNEKREISKEEGLALAQIIGCKYYETTLDTSEEFNVNIFQQITFLMDSKLGGTLFIDNEIETLLKSLEMKKEQIPEIFVNDREKTFTFLTQLMKGKQNVNKQSVMVVGQENVGKTTFIKHLLGNSWMGSTFSGYDILSQIKSDPITNSSFSSSISSSNNDNDIFSSSGGSSLGSSLENSKEPLLGSSLNNSNNSNKSSNNNNRAQEIDSSNHYSYRTTITDGVDINHWVLDDNNFTITFFDFAGQELYYNTHQFFLCKDSIYILMFKGKDSLNKNRVAHWIHTIITKAPSTKLFLVATHMEDAKAILNIKKLNRELTDLIDNIQFLVEKENKLDIIRPDNAHEYAKEKLIFWSISLTTNFSCNSNQLTELIEKLTFVSKEKVENFYFPDNWSKFRYVLFPYLKYENRNIIEEELERQKKNELNKLENNNKDNKNNKNKNKNKNKNNNNSYNNTRDLVRSSSLIYLRDIGVDPETITESGYMDEPQEAPSKDKKLKAKPKKIKEKENIGILSQYPIDDYQKFKEKALQNDLKEGEVDLFIDLLSSWGEIIPIKNSRTNQRQIVLNPVWLITVFKFFITAKRLNRSIQSKVRTFKSIFHFSNHKKKKGDEEDSENDSDDEGESGKEVERKGAKRSLGAIIKAAKNKSKSEESRSRCNNKKIKTISENEDYITSLSQIEKEWNRKFNENSGEETKKKIIEVISLLTELQLLIPIDNGKYLIPALLVDKPIPTNVRKYMDEIEKNCGKISAIKYEEENATIEVERSYNMTFLPSGLFTRLMMSIWQWRRINIKDIWGNGFVVGELNSEISSAIVRYVQSPNSTSACIFINIRCKKDHIGDLLPSIHRSIVHIVQSLEIEKHVSPHCRFPKLKGLQKTYFLYDDCLTSAIGNSYTIELDKNLLVYLIPELYRAISKKLKVSDEEEQERYNREIKEIKFLAGGASGQVFEGIWYNQLVAIKKIHNIDDSFEIQSLINEIGLLQSLKHSNILRLYDVYKKPFSIVTELCPFGDLSDVIQSTESLPPITAIRIIRDISAGLGYLHNHSPPIIHCDVRLPNIFIKNLSVNENICAVLGDVGFSRVADRNISSGVRSIRNDLHGFSSIIRSIISKLESDLTSFSSILNKDNDNNKDSNINNDINNNDKKENEKEKEKGKENGGEKNQLRNSEKETGKMAKKDTEKEKENNLLKEKEKMKKGEEKVKLIETTISSLTDFNQKLITYTNCDPSSCDLSKESIQLDHLIESISSQFSFHKFIDLNEEENPIVKKISDISKKKSDQKLDQFFEFLELARREIKGIGYLWLNICSISYPILKTAIANDKLTVKDLDRLKDVEFIDIGNVNGIKLTHLAAKSGNSLLLNEIFLKLDTHPNSSSFSRKKTALHYAVQAKDYLKDNVKDNSSSQLIYVLHRYGADLNVIDKKGRTPLLIAAKLGNFNCLLALLNLKADPNIVDRRGCTPIIAAASSNSPNRRNCIRALLQFGSMFCDYHYLDQECLNLIKSEAELLISNQFSYFARTFFISNCSLRSWSKAKLVN